MTDNNLISHYLRLIIVYLNTPKKVGVFLSMAIWAVIIRVILHNFKTSRVIPIVMRSKKKINLPIDHITRYLYWLERLKILHSRGDCLPKSLVFYRFLVLIGEKPNLIIGLQKQTGHAWVELDGESIGESPAASSVFVPTMILRPGMKYLTSVDGDSTQIGPN